MTVKLLSEVCHDVQVEPTLLSLTEEWMEHRNAIEAKEATSDIRVRGFWIRGQQAFFRYKGIWSKHMRTLEFIPIAMLCKQRKRKKAKL